MAFDIQTSGIVVAGERITNGKKITCNISYCIQVDRSSKSVDVDTSSIQALKKSTTNKQQQLCANKKNRAYCSNCMKLKVEVVLNCNFEKHLRYSIVNTLEYTYNFKIRLNTVKSKNNCHTDDKYVNERDWKTKLTEKNKVYFVKSLMVAMTIISFSEEKTHKNRAKIL